MLKCFKPEEIPSKRVLLVDLEKARAALEHENGGLKARVTDLRRQLDAVHKDKQSWAACRAELEGALQHRSQRSSQLLTHVTQLKSQLNDAVASAPAASAHPTTLNPAPPASSKKGRPSVTPASAASRSSNAALLGKQQSVSATDVLRGPAGGAEGSCAGSEDPGEDDDSAVEPSKPSVDGQIDGALRVVERLLAELLAGHTTALDELGASRAQSQALQRELDVVRKQGETSKSRAKHQMIALELRCGALESESEGLNEIRTDMQEHLLRLQRDLTKLRTQSGMDQAALCEAAALAQHSSVQVNSTEAELLVVQTAAGAAALEAAQREAQLLQLTTQSSQAAQESAASRAALLRSDAQLQASESGLRAAEEQLQSLRREMEESRGQVSTLQAEAVRLVQELTACRLELSGVSVQLASSRVELSARDRELTATAARLQDSLQRSAAAAAAALRTAAELSECQQGLQDNQAQYIATKSKLIATAKQLANTAKDHSSAIELQHDSDTTAADASHRATEATHKLAAVSERLSVVTEQLAVTAERESAAGAELGHLRAVHAAASAELRRHQTLLTSLARLPQQGMKDSEHRDADTYTSVVSEQSLRLKVCESSLPVCAAVAAGVLDSACLSHLVLDLDISREAVWEKAALRISSLAACLGLSKSVATLELVGWTWEEMGNGSCAPFLALAGAQPRSPPPLPLTHKPYNSSSSSSSSSQRSTITHNVDTSTPQAQVPVSPRQRQRRQRRIQDQQQPPPESEAGCGGVVASVRGVRSTTTPAMTKQSSVSLTQLQQRSGSSGGGGGGGNVGAGARGAGSVAGVGPDRLSSRGPPLRAPSPGFSCVSVDTRLFDVDACVLLRELMMGGAVELKRPDGSGVLKLSASAHPKLDAWYNEMVRNAPLGPIPAPISASSRSNSSGSLHNLPQSNSTTTTSTTTTYNNHNTNNNNNHNNNNYYNNQNHNKGAASSSSSGSAPMDLPPGLPRPGSRPFLPLPPSQASLATLGQHQVAVASSAVSVAEPPSAAAPVDCDLSNEALESHHCVLVMAVLLACPHLRQLQLGGNKLGDLGAELLAMGLQHNQGLRTLGLARNAIRAGGARKLARALESNQGLRTLDLEGQRLEGLGPAGAEALASMLRTNTTLLELNVRSSGIGNAGATALATALRAAADSAATAATATSVAVDGVERGVGGPGLQRLCVDLASMDTVATNALQAASAERGGSLVIS
ncbi:MAG: hypothetical protein WDW36_001332 [Sanguina aurantia]